MTASLPVMFLVTVTALAMGYAFYLDVRRDAEHRRFLEWLETERKAHWKHCLELTGCQRSGPSRYCVAARWRMTRNSRSGIGQRGTGRRFDGAMLVRGVSITLLLVGTTFLDWAW